MAEIVDFSNCKTRIGNLDGAKNGENASAGVYAAELPAGFLLLISR